MRLVLSAVGWLTQGLLIASAAAVIAAVLAVLFVPTRAFDVLRGLGMDPDAAVESLQRTMGSDPRGREAAPTPPPPPEPNVPAARKAINSVPLAEVPRNSGIMSMEAFGRPTTREAPYNLALGFNNVTIVAVTKSQTLTSNGLPDYVWVAVVVPGDRLERTPQGLPPLSDLDGTTRDRYFYRGFTAWILVPSNVIVTRKGSSAGTEGIGAVLFALKVGGNITLRVEMNQARDGYRRMNWESFERLAASLGRPNDDRSNQAFLFKVDFAWLDPD